MYEHVQQKLAPKKVFYRRMAYNLAVATFLLLICLLVGVVGYHVTDGIPWIDSIHNASLILSGMGPVVEIKSTAGKLFSSFYALFSGVAFITNIGIVLTPAAHRFFHKLHIQDW